MLSLPLSGLTKCTYLYRSMYAKSRFSDFRLQPLHGCHLDTLNDNLQYALRNDYRPGLYVFFYSLCNRLPFPLFLIIVYLHCATTVEEKHEPATDREQHAAYRRFCERAVLPCSRAAIVPCSAVFRVIPSRLSHRPAKVSRQWTDQLILRPQSADAGRQRAVNVAGRYRLLLRSFGFFVRRGRHTDGTATNGPGRTVPLTVTTCRALSRVRHRLPAIGPHLPHDGPSCRD